MNLLKEINEVVIAEKEKAAISHTVRAAVYHADYEKRKKKRKAKK